MRIIGRISASVCIDNSLLLYQHHTPYLAKMPLSVGDRVTLRLTTRRQYPPNC
jgi:hypothetical protein